MLSLKLFFITFWTLALFTQISQAGVFRSSLCHSAIEQTFKELNNQNYNKAFALNCSNQSLEKLRKSMIFLDRYDDLGKSSDLDSSNILIKNLSFDKSTLEGQFWMGMTKLQQGFILNVQGSPFQASLKSREGALLMSKLDFDDAQAFYAIYNYYKSQLTSWIPFAQDSRKEALIILQEPSLEQSYFYRTLKTSSIWLYYDSKNWNEAQKSTLQLLNLASTNRISNQIRGDILRKSGLYEQSLNHYIASEKNYRDKALYSIRHLSAIGNILLNQKMLKKNIDKDLWDEFNKEVPEVENKMPESLLKELKNAKIY